MMNKKAQTFTSLIWTMILVMVFFFGMFGYMNSNFQNAGVVESVGGGINASLNYYNEELTTNIDEIETKSKSIAEADGNILQIAWNGLTGVAATISMFFAMIGIALGLWDAVIPGLMFLPPIINMLVKVGITATIVLLIIGAFKGEAKT